MSKKKKAEGTAASGLAEVSVAPWGCWLHDAGEPDLINAHLHRCPYLCKALLPQCLPSAEYEQ